MGSISSEIQLDLSLVEDEAADIQRCLSVLFSTPKGTVPLDRNFGLDWSGLDYPTETAKSLMAAEIVKQTAKYEPRATVQGITWVTGSNGTIQAKVVITNV